MRDPFPVVCKLGERLIWRDQKALVLLVAMNGPWEPAGQLADALGISPDLQEQIYAEAVAKRAAADGAHAHQLDALPIADGPRPRARAV